MKKLIALTLALALALTLCACGQKAEETTQTPAEPAEGKEMVLGTLSLLNMTEEEYLAKLSGKNIAIQYLTEQGAHHNNPNEVIPDSTAGARVIFYDTLDAMLMALEAGDINAAEVPVCVADYLCAHNNKLTTTGSFDLSNADDFTKKVAYRLGVGFSFLTTEDKIALRDELDSALTEMKADGTLDALVQTYITDAVGGEPQPLEFTKTDGETIRVAVTGALPPMDYVAADGTPAGFNTAVLAEIANRTGKNIELVVVDSLGRAAALASGAVDAVFWTRTSSFAQKAVAKTKDEREASKATHRVGMTEEEVALMNELAERMNPTANATADMPEGTIVTEPYFTDVLVPVMLAGGGPQGK